MFEQISSKLQGVIKKLRGEGRLTEAHVDAALKELRMALLEADVHFRVAREFTSRVREKAVGQEVLASLSAPQQVLKIMRDEMVRLLGGSESPLELDGKWPAVILMTGLSGSGKTTTTAKLGKWLAAQRKHPALVSVDGRRPAALEQLKVLSDQVGLRCLEPDTLDPVARARAAKADASDAGFDVLIVDTAGRLHVDPQLMEELRQLVEATSPVEVLFVADSMTGQDAVRSADAFGKVVPLTGHVLTKLDGDARGGAALSLAATTGRSIKFVGVGEKLDALEPFHPDRMASRILGMGDVLTLIERAEQAVEQDQAEELARKLRREELSLEDFRVQLQQLGRMGSIGEILSFLPNAGGGLMPNIPSEFDESEIRRFEAILNSMTKGERLNASIINGSRRRRIARGSGCAVSDVNRLLRRFAEARKMARVMARSKGGLGGLKQLKKMSRMR
jgi:signal recognition particle subunit SRP54